MFFQPWALLISLPSVLAFCLLLRDNKLEKKRKKHPIAESLFRPPGESCRLKLEELNDQFFDRFCLLFSPVALAIILSATTRLNPISCVLFFIIACPVGWHAKKRLEDNLKDISHYRLGFEGERFVGQALNEALSFGCKVYHDLQFDGYNIDHVIVAPSGLFAIETKTRRKGFSKNDHRVIYDGQKLIFPEWADGHGLAQAQRNAKSLAVWLTSAVGERVSVAPILTLPGWWIDCTGKGPVSVLNPKGIVKFVIAGSQPILSQQLMDRISHQLEQKSLIS